MNSSNFMDKEITQLSKSHSFFDDDDDDDDSLDAEPPFSFRPIPPKSTTLNQVSGVGALISEIDRKIKEHTENVVQAVGGLSALVSQLENRTRQLENAVGDLKDSVEFNHGRIEGKIREFGNMVEEVQGGIRDLRDKHEIAEAQLQLAKLKMSKVDQSNSKPKVEQSSATQIGSAQELQSSVPWQPQIQVSVPVTCPQQLSSLPSGAAQNILHQNNPSSHAAATAPQIPIQFPPGAFPCVLHSESTYPLSMPTPDTTYQQYPLPSNQQMQQSMPAPPQPYQPVPQLPSTPQLPHPHQQNPPIRIVNSHTALPLGCESKDVPYLPSQSIHNSSLPPARSPTVNEFFASSKQQNQGQFSNNPYTELPSGYSHAQGHSSSKNRYSYGASSPSYNGSATKPSQLSPSSVEEAGRNHSGLPTTKILPHALPTAKILPHALPTAKILPHALPTASSVDSGLHSSEIGHRLPVDDIIDKVVAMGFRRDLVRATVRKLTANGQSVDLNVVLDKLMNGQDI